MAFNLNGVVRERMITELFIPKTRYAMVSDRFVVTKTQVDAESIKIWGVGAVTVGSYTGGTVTPNFHVDTSVLLSLTEAEYFNEAVEAIDSEQSAIDILPGIIEDGSYQIGQGIDKAVFAEIATTTNVVADPVLDSTTIRPWIGEIKTKMTNLGIPSMGRALALSPEMVALLAEANVELNTSTAEEAAKEGFVGRFYGFDIYESVNTGTSGTAIATNPRCGALGIGFNQLGVDAIPGQFYSVAKGLTNYGVKLSQPDYAVKSVVTFA